MDKDKIKLEAEIVDEMYLNFLQEKEYESLIKFNSKEIDKEFGHE